MDKQRAYDFISLRNNGVPMVMKQLIDLKNVFAKQLPKMPKEYIVRLVFDAKHESIVLVDEKGVIFGGVTFCVFMEVRLCEIVFLAISSDHQIKGFGTILMNRLKSEMQARRIAFMMTCADNLAIGYFQKQGFHSGILMPCQLYKGYLKDYEGSTLMECLLDDRVDYNKIPEQIKEFKRRLYEEINERIQLNRVYPGLKESDLERTKDGKINLRKIPGLEHIEGLEREYEEIEKIKVGSCFRSNCLNILEQLKNHKSAWPFLHAVKKEEVPDYYDVISEPMWLTKMEEKVNQNAYESKADFIRDLELIISNCQSYNQKNTIYYKSSTEMQKYMHQLLATLRDETSNPTENGGHGEGEAGRTANSKNRKVKQD